jgi:hypothetical protein
MLRLREFAVQLAPVFLDLAFLDMAGCPLG